MKILVVGAGAVGQTFAHHLHRGGAEVAFLAKPAYADELRAGLVLYDLRASDGARRPIRVEGLRVLTGNAEVAAEPWDAVVITVSAAALKQGSWVAELVAAAPGATIVGMQPGLGDPAFVREVAGADRVVWGVIELIAYQAPLPGETVPSPGIAFYVPPWLPLPFAGPPERTAAIVAAFRAGGLWGRAVADTEVMTAVGGPLMNLTIAALEASGWSLERVRGDHELLALTHRAIGQAAAVAARVHGVRVPMWVGLVRPAAIRLLARVAPSLFPFDIQTYLQFHFTKVGEQMRQSLDGWIAHAAALGLPSDALVELRARRDAGGGGARGAVDELAATG